MRKQFKDIDIYAGIKAQDGAKWIKDNGIVADPSTSRYVPSIRKKTSKVWNTSTLQPVFLLISVVRTL